MSASHQFEVSRSIVVGPSTGSLLASDAVGDSDGRLPPTPLTFGTTAQSGGTPAAIVGQRRALFWVTFFAIIGAGAFLRFWRISHQSYWCDEAFTIKRVDASFHWVLQALNQQGFPPGWYVTLWGYVWLVTHWLHIPQGTALTAAYMRLVPAFLGTLMVPSAYFLARHFTGRWQSLLIMLLVAVNPFLIYYSRDLKMYGAFYLLTTLNVALYFKWQGSDRQWLWYPLWACSGAAMLLTDTLGWFLVAIEMLWLICKQRHRPWDVPLWCLGAGVMGVVPTWWYLCQNHWLINHAQNAVPWVQSYNGINWRTIVGLPCVHLLGFLWPVYPPSDRMIHWFSLPRHFSRNLAGQTIPWLAKAEFWIAIGVGLIMLWGLVPRWQRLKRIPAEPRPVGRRWHLVSWIGLPMTLFALGSLPVHSRWSIYPHHVIWQQRYLGFIAMAWVVWLGMALASLPTLVLRISAMVAVVMVCAIFALTNQFFYRQIIWKPIEKVAIRYFSPSHPKEMMLACPRRTHGVGTLGFEWMSVGHIDPHDYSWRDLPIIRRVPDTPLSWIHLMRWINANRSVRTLVTVEDMPPDISRPLEQIAIPRALGPHWRLVEAKVYQWHYQWWFYFYTTWHVQVWQRATAHIAHPGKPTS
ncbi:MAG: hypothetical protein HKL95_10225 [Phycisphaerae bacterium]|nr:hypothetical protein [Phycisphaerae bacterium]